MTSINFGTLIPIIVSVLSGGLGLSFFVFAWQRKKHENITQNWQPTPGIILSSEIKEHAAVDPAKNTSTIFSPVIRYQYSCTGNVFIGSRIAIRSTETTQAKARQTVDRYTAGNSVTVYYDPLHPEETVLERNTRGYPLLFSTGLILCGISLGSCCISLIVFWIGKAGL